MFSRDGLPRQQLVELLEDDDAVGARAVIGVPFSRMRPRPGAMKPATAFSSVDLPHPDGPRIDEAIGPVDVEAHAIGRGHELLARPVLQRDAVRPTEVPVLASRPEYTLAKIAPAFATSREPQFRRQSVRFGSPRSSAGFGAASRGRVARVFPGKLEECHVERTER